MNPMQDIYRRLRALGFDKTYVQAWFLPEWWEDSLAKVPANRALAEAAVAKMLALPLRDLRDRDADLKLPGVKEVRLKRRVGTEEPELATAIALAARAASSIVRSLQPLHPFSGLKTAIELRQSILSRSTSIGLESLLEFAWDCGIAVIHISQFPKTLKKFHGMALFCNNVPVIVLGFGSDSPPWLAFHLSHEMGHIFLGHVRSGIPPLADGNIDQKANDPEERQADEFACELLTEAKRPSLEPKYGLTGPKLARAAREAGTQLKIDAGTLALIYGRSAQRMPAAQSALKFLGMDRGARQMIASALKRHLPPDLPDHTARFVSLATAA